MEVDEENEQKASPKAKNGEYKETENGQMEETEEATSRPCTPSNAIFDIIPKNEDEWWRPSHPPETYMWEEVRRQREKGGYPWTLLDQEKEDEIDAHEYLDDDNLYEPVNPPPLYATGSRNLQTNQHGRGSLPKIHIPPEIDIVTSEGLDGLDQPDRYEHGLDGDREWAHSDDEHSQSQPQKIHFTAGIRHSDSQKSDKRPLTNKAIAFDEMASAKDTENPEMESEPDYENAQEVPSSSPKPPVTPTPPRKKTTAFEILKGKAVDAAGQMKQRFKIALPVRPKLNQWEGVKLARKKPKKKGRSESVEPEQQVPEGQVDDMGEGTAGAGEETKDVEMEHEHDVADEATSVEPPSVDNNKEAEDESKAEALKREKQEAAEEKKRKQKEAEELKKQKAEEKKREQEELRLKKEKEAEEKKKEQEELRLKKEKEAEEKRKEQEELRLKKEKEAEEKRKEQEEIKRQKAEEKQRLKEEQEKKKAEEKAAKQKASEEAKKAKLEEQLIKAREAEQLEKQKQDELLRQREEAAEAAAAALLESNINSEPAEDLVSTDIVPHEEVLEEPEIETPTGTGSRRKKIKKTYVKLPELPKMPDLPHIDLDFKRKVIKRSKTPPSRPQPPKSKRRGVDDIENQLAVQYADEIASRKLEMEAEDEDHEGEGSGSKLQDPSILITQPSTEAAKEPTTEQHVQFKGLPPKKEEAEQEQKKQITTQERLDKFGQTLKSLGIKSKEIASKKSKSMGETMKVVGKDLQKLGVKTSEKFQAHIEEIKAKQEAAKARTKEMKAKEAEDAGIEEPMDDEDNIQYPDYATEPRRKFRFRRRNESQEEPEAVENQDNQHYENPIETKEAVGETKTDEERRTRSQLLGRAERDWESPLDLVQSRDASEEPFSGNASSRDSPPGSSLASSTFAHVRKQGVLEEIDSDEFFLREKGISEGEDEEEINRFLVEELRQAFRTQENALSGFDLPESPLRPERLPRKPPRKEKSEDKSPNYQTFPPERPKRKTPGYVSEYMQGQEEGEEVLDDDQYSNQEERGSGSYQEDFGEEFQDDGMRKVKEELEKIDKSINDDDENFDKQEYEDDGRYEPIRDGPIKPSRRKRQPETSTPLYYNTVAGNEWMRDVEEQIVKTPEAPRRDRSKRSKSNSMTRGADNKSDIAFADDVDSKLIVPDPPLAQAESEGRIDDAEIDMDDNFEYVDEAGYAVVHKGRATPPTTTPRKKKRGGGSKSSSLKRQGDSPTADNNQAFFSLQRGAQRSSHIVPPSRPQRSYSTLKPRRPPRLKSNPNLGPKSKGDKSDGARPSTAIGIMQGRPLPAPPRPERSPAPMNNLDQSSIERAVGARHYANFADDGSMGDEIVEQPFTATNIPLLGRLRYEPDASGDANISVQADLLLGDFNDDAAVVSQDTGRRVQQQGDSLNTTATDGRDSRQGRPKTPADNQSQPPFSFPRRLHLDELDVSVLRVHDLTAHSIAVDHLQASQIEVNSFTSLGPLSVSSIHTQTVNSDQVNCNRLASDTVDLPSVPPPSFFNLSSPQPVPDNETEEQPTNEEKPEELRLSDKDEVEDEIVCPYTPFEDDPEIHFENLAASPKPEPIFEEDVNSSTSNDFFLSSREVEFCLTPDQSLEHEDNWDHLENVEKSDDVPPQQEEDATPCDYVTGGVQVVQPGMNEEFPIAEDEVVGTFRFSNNQSNTNNETATTPVPSLQQLVDEENTLKEELKIVHSVQSTEILSVENTTEQCDEATTLGKLEIKVARVTSPTKLGNPSSPEPTSSVSYRRQVPEQINENRPNIRAGTGYIPEMPRARQQSKSSSQSVPAAVEAEETQVRGSKIIQKQSQTSSSSTQQPQPIASSSSASVTECSTTSDVLRRQVTPERGAEDIFQLGSRLCRAISRITIRGLQAMIEYIDVATTDDPSKAEQQRAHMQVLLCVLLVLIAGIMLSSQSGVSPPRWEFLMPPPNL